MYYLFNINTKEFLIDQKTFENKIFTKNEATELKYIYGKLTGQKYKIVKIN